MTRTHSIPALLHLRGVEMMEEEPTKIDYFAKQIP